MKLKVSCIKLHKKFKNLRNVKFRLWGFNWFSNLKNKSYFFRRHFPVLALA